MDLFRNNKIVLNVHGTGKSLLHNCGVTCDKQTGSSGGSYQECMVDHCGSYASVHYGAYCSVTGDYFTFWVGVHHTKINEDGDGHNYYSFTGNVEHWDICTTCNGSKTENTPINCTHGRAAVHSYCTHGYDYQH